MSHRGKIKRAALLVLLLACTVSMCLTGCGSEEQNYTELSDAAAATQPQAGSAGKPITIKVIYDPILGESWDNVFGQGVQKVLNKVQGGSYMSDVELSGITAEEAIRQAVKDDCDGILLVADPQSWNVDEIIQQTRESGVPVVSLGDAASNGYNLAVPDDMGQSMTRTLVAFVALQKGADAWGDIEDFVRQLENAVQGSWSTANSSGDWKAFAVPYVMEFSVDDSGRSKMDRASMIEGIFDTPDRKGYSYRLNTGNHYYLFPRSPKTMECHWEPDGYSGSDSLCRTEGITTESGGNSSYFFDMNSYKGTQEYFRGTVSKFEGYGVTEEPEECYALNLESPVRIMTPDGKDIVIYAMQLNGDETLESYAKKGTMVKATGELFEAHTAHHFTPVLLNVDRIK